MEAIVQDGLPKGAYEFQYTLSNGKRPDCVVFLPDQRPLVHRREISARGGDRVARRAHRRGEASIASAAAAQRRDEARHRHRREISDPRRDPGHGADVRAVGIGLRRAARRLRRRGAEGLSRPGRDGVAVAADAGDPGDAADPEGRAHARGRRPDPHRGRPTDGRRRPPARARAASCRSISARPTRTSGRS